ncbi:insulinase family protein [Streptomyces sp. UNOC14_S4]|uniref:M16 family metallopeptidase n=1 Tax=Streptomyces sp. UNOC14_S4 TaxID=2872340 RepID=UPI001E321B0F|nr:insulinase family protein [Streptomyces sp. UNOC14_S4]MCC3770094.1 insulinase family protein [Streptomyces sp. UNOC14_S4]
MGRTRTRVLPNGIRLVAVERPGAPLAAVLLRVGVGSADEEPDERGLAHVLEHMVVRCAMDGGRAGDGALVTARTGKEATVYSTVVRHADVLPAVAALGPVLGELDVPPGEFAAELTAIREERAQRSADPAWRLQESLMGALWAGTRRAHPVLGDPYVVDALTPRRAYRFHRRWYRPATAVLVVVTDRLDRLLPRIAATAAAWGHGRPGGVDLAPGSAPHPASRPDSRSVLHPASRPVPLCAERPAVGRVAVSHGPLAGVAAARPGAESAAAVLACDAVRAATGLVLRTLPLGEWLCVWAMTKAADPVPVGDADSVLMGDVVRTALAAARARISRPDGAAWLRTEVLIPRLRAEDDIETAAQRASDPRAAVGTDELTICQARSVGDVLAEWRRWFGPERPVGGPVAVPGAAEGP